MGINDGCVYPPLSRDTETRVLVLAPESEGEPIRCFHLVIDLDSDWRLPRTSESMSLADPSQHVMPFVEVKKEPGEVLQRLLVNLTIGDDGRPHSFQRYTALSYTWGDQTKQHTINLNGKPFSVGDNLHVALRRLQGRMQMQASSEGALPVHSESPCLAPYIAHQGRIIWIDAICINQADLAERESQVKLMSRIYQQADLVHADLGYPLDNSGVELLELLQTIENAGKKCRALRRESSNRIAQNNAPELLGISELTEAVWSKWENFNSGRASSSSDAGIPAYTTKVSLESQGIPPPQDPIWDKWRMLISSVYFERLWIIQEYVFAKTITLWFGNVGVDSRMLARCIACITEYSTRSSVALYLASRDKTNGMPTGASNALFSLIGQRLHAESSPQRNLLEQLSLTRHTKATDARDKLYATLAFASDGPQFHHLVSYTSPLETVFLGFAEQFVQSGHGLEMLYQVNSGSSKSIDTPTWVPDWSQNWEESSIHHRLASGVWDAATGSKTSRLQLFKPDRRLTIAGAIVDTIKSVTNALPHTETFVSSFDFFQFMLKGRDLSLQLPMRNENDFSETELLTLLCRPKHTIAPEELRKMTDSLFAVFGLMTSIMSKDSSQSYSWLPHTDPIFEQGVPNAIGRSWCLTENGHFGLVPGRARAGDRVAIFYGGREPFVIRQCSPAANADHRLIGHGYFHGLMNGEAFDVPEFNPTNLTLV